MSSSGSRPVPEADVQFLYLLSKAQTRCRDASVLPNGLECVRCRWSESLRAGRVAEHLVDCRARAWGPRALLLEPLGPCSATLPELGTTSLRTAFADPQPSS